MMWSEWPGTRLGTQGAGAARPAPIYRDHVCVSLHLSVRRQLPHSRNMMLPPGCHRSYGLAAYVYCDHLRSKHKHYCVLDRW